MALAQKARQGAIMDTPLLDLLRRQHREHMRELRRFRHHLDSRLCVIQHLLVKIEANTRPNTTPPPLREVGSQTLTVGKPTLEAG